MSETYGCSLCGHGNFDSPGVCRKCYLKIKDRDRLEGIRAMQAIWGMPKRFDKARLDDHPKASTIKRHLARRDNIIITGSNGTGKTWLGVGIVRYVISIGQTALFATVTDILSEIKATFRQGARLDESDILEYLRTVDFLLIDDLGKQVGTPFENTTVYRFIAHRCANQMPVGITTNLDREEMQNESPEMRAVVDRLREDALHIKFVGKSRRKVADTIKIEGREDDG